MYSIKMRAGQKAGQREIHISGAEKIVSEDRLDICCRQILDRALKHAKGEPDTINIKIEKVMERDIRYLDALPVTKCDVDTAEQGIDRLRGLLMQLGLNHVEDILAMLNETYAMRGAMLLHVDTLERLEPKPDRGIRATYMDMAEKEDDRSEKNHFKEALVLATKVCSHPNIVGEICISDDPDYVTGYFASRSLGYVRITKLKEMGSPNGGRIFLFRGTKEEAADCIQYMEKQKVLVRLHDAKKE